MVWQKEMMMSSGAESVLACSANADPVVTISSANINANAAINIPTSITLNVIHVQGHGSQRASKRYYNRDERVSKQFINITWWSGGLLVYSRSHL